MLDTLKIPINQLISFSDIGDDAQTALDPSEYRIVVLKKYFEKFDTSNADVKEKLDFINNQILYNFYIFCKN